MMGHDCISFRLCFTGARGFQCVQPCGSGRRDEPRHALRETYGWAGARGQAGAERRRSASWRAAITSQQVPACLAMMVTCRTILRWPHDADAAQLSHRASCGSHRDRAGRGRHADGVRRASPSASHLDRSSPPSLAPTLKPAAAVEYLTEVTTITCC